MANLCFNTLIVEGPRETIKKIRDYIKFETDKHGTKYVSSFFNSFYPTPEELDNDGAPAYKKEGETEKIYKKRMEERKQKYGATDWRNWNVNNRGTKRDIHDVYLDEFDNSDGRIKMYFNTAWLPGDKAITKLAELHPDVLIELYYDEEGMGFSGEMIREDGKFKSEIYYDDDPYYGEGVECSVCGHKVSPDYIEDGVCDDCR